MSSSDRRRFVLAALAVLSLTGCGYAPVYGTGGVAETLQGRIRAADPTDENAFAFVGRLENRLGLPQAPVYDLNYSIALSEDKLAISGTQEITRYNVLGAVDFTVTDRRSGAIVTSGTVDSFTGYSTSGTTVTSRVAQSDAYDRLMVILADQLVSRLLATAGAWTE